MWSEQLNFHVFSRHLWAQSHLNSRVVHLWSDHPLTENLCRARKRHSCLTNKTPWEISLIPAALQESPSELLQYEVFKHGRGQTAAPQVCNQCCQKIKNWHTNLKAAFTDVIGIPPPKQNRPSTLYEAQFCLIFRAVCHLCQSQWVEGTGRGRRGTSFRIHSCYWGHLLCLSKAGVRLGEKKEPSSS